MSGWYLLTYRTRSWCCTIWSKTLFLPLVYELFSFIIQNYFLQFYMSFIRFFLVLLSFNRVQCTVYTTRNTSKAIFFSNCVQLFISFFIISNIFHLYHRAALCLIRLSTHEIFFGCRMIHPLSTISSCEQQTCLKAWSGYFPSAFVCFSSNCRILNANRKKHLFL